LLNEKSSSIVMTHQKLKRFLQIIGAGRSGATMQQIVDQRKFRQEDKENIEIAKQEQTQHSERAQIHRERIEQNQNFLLQQQN
jgi:hypothetical protein